MIRIQTLTYNKFQSKSELNDKICEIPPQIKAVEKDIFKINNTLRVQNNQLKNHMSMIRNNIAVFINDPQLFYLGN